MRNLRLVLPTKSHREKALAYKKEFFDNGEDVINGSALLDQLDYDEWLDHVKKYSNEETAGSDWVPSTTFFAVDDKDEIVGMIDVRHHLNHPFLKEYGGHIGYSIRPCARRKGYATKMLELALDYVSEIGLKRVMLGCFADNVPSIKTIVNNGGLLAEEKPYIDGQLMRVYWIEIKN